MKQRILYMILSLALTFGCVACSQTPSTNEQTLGTSPNKQTTVAPTAIVTHAPTLAPSQQPTPTTSSSQPTVAANETSGISSGYKETKETTVYITRTGKKYHRAGCRYLSRSQIPVSLSQAKLGYTPCSVCHPPQ